VSSRGGAPQKTAGRQAVRPEQEQRGPYRVRLPALIEEDEIGLGDAVKKVTYAMGIRRPCGGCERRAAILNRWVHLSK
jgi:hypothetical protein